MRGIRFGLACFGVLLFVSGTLMAQQPALTIGDLVRKTGPQLDALYASGTVPPIPKGRVSGRAIYYPGTKLAVPMSVGARVAWQGKIFDPVNATAMNKFFGIRSVPGKLYQGESWRDGAPALILDYQETSRIYVNYRDEIRQVGPGLYLGLMHDRRTSPPTLKMYFALEDRD